MMTKDQEITPLRAQEMAASKAALKALRQPVPAPPASTQAPDQAARNSHAWGMGWRWGYYHHDETLDTKFTGEELKAFMQGVEAGYEALEITELIPKAIRMEEEAKAKGRTIREEE